ncbi:hypothetical protein HBI37_089520 [Parastagonospora nodorum]|nr:hypothetical protein HBI36_207350 [Parastagonospora nodorum]KAH6344064.1 hypothetical protein HBI37_089520 [Parastagonospora nodorum]
MLFRHRQAMARCGGDVFGLRISSAIACNGTHGGVVQRSYKRLSRPAASTSASLVHPASSFLLQLIHDYAPLALSWRRDCDR